MGSGGETGDKGAGHGQAAVVKQVRGREGTRHVIFFWQTDSEAGE